VGAGMSAWTSELNKTFLIESKKLVRLNNCGSLISIVANDHDKIMFLYVAEVELIVCLVIAPVLTNNLIIDI
jgi:hypothetical protein